MAEGGKVGVGGGAAEAHLKRGEKVFYFYAFKYIIFRPNQNLYPLEIGILNPLPQPKKRGGNHF